MKNNSTNRRTRSGLWFYFTVVVFFTILIIFFIILTIWVLLYRNQYIAFYPEARGGFAFLLLLASIIIGGAISFIVGRLIIRPIHHMGEAFSRLAEGDFDVRVSTKERVEEIREMATRFNAMAHDLSQIETLRSDFVTNVSHEFKTPIAAIEGYATLLQNEQLEQEKRQLYVDKIISNSRKLSDLTSNVLTLSKLENQETVPDLAQYRLDEQIRKNLLLLENKWDEKNLDFDLRLPDTMFYGNEPLLDEVWFNLLDNAIKHSPENGAIEISLSSSDAAVTVRIADHGDGMDTEVQKHIFEKFYQGDASHAVEGSGLGLSLVKQIVSLCGGEVDVESAPGEGAAFTVTLPD